MSNVLDKKKCKGCKRVLKKRSYYSSLGKESDRFCSVECIEKHADKYFKAQEEFGL